MLEIVRRSKGFTRVILSFVVVAVAGTFGVSLYGIWGGALTDPVQGAPDWIMVVDGERIPAAEFLQRRAMVEQDLRERLAGQEVDAQTLGSVVDQQALAGILGFHLASRQAEAAGLDVADTEVSETIRQMPVFQRSGRFVGVSTYTDLLRAQGLNVAEFESRVAGELAAEKMRLALFGVAKADEKEVDRRFREEIERADVDYVLLADATFTSGLRASESELRAWFARKSDQYMTEEKRDASFVVFDREARAAAVQVPEEEIRQAYDAARGTRFTHGEQRRASHILLRVDPATSPEEAAAKEAAANDLLATIRSGGSFEEIARGRSEDPGSARSGGDLGWFERGRMVPQFDEVAFSLPIGSVSDVFRTDFGFHIVKATDTRPAGTRSFEEVSEELRRELAVQKAQAEVRAAADDFTTRLAAQTSSFQGTAAEMGLTMEQTGGFGRGEPAGRLGRLPMAEDAVFALTEGATSSAVSVPQGLAVFHLDRIEAPRPEAFETVRARVEEDWKKERARDSARQSARRILDAPGDLSARAAAGKLEVKSYAAITRLQPMPPLTDAAKEAALLAEEGTVIGPFDSADGLIVLQVTRKAPSSQAEAEAERAALREEILQEERAAVYQAVMARLQKNAAIEVNQGLLTPGSASR